MDDSIRALLRRQLPSRYVGIEAQERGLSLEASMKEEMLKVLPFDSGKCSIYRVPRRQFNMNPTAYTPQVISIGPFHHGREHLMAMERHKLLVLNIYLRRINMRVEDAIATARNWETEARGFYAEPINMSKDEFVKMMLLDGCFIVEFMILVYQRFSSPNQSLTLDCSFYAAMESHLCYDLIMLENQLPLFVVEALFSQLSACDDGNALRSLTFDKLIQCFIELGCVRLSSGVHPEWDIKTKNANHLVHLLSNYYNPPSLGNHSIGIDCSNVGGIRNFFGSITSFFFFYNLEKSESIEFLLTPPTLTELWEAGVTIKKSGKEKHSMEISFNDGVLQIPHFEIDDQFETRVRNVMAFEHYHLGRSKRYVTNYILFLDDLISTERDVSLLVKAEILKNYIGGSHEEVSKLFNDLCKGVTSNETYYYDTTKALSKYCKATRHRWMASLRRDYFNSPWTSISFFAATLLIILTFLQTLYSLLSYYK